MNKCFIFILGLCVFILSNCSTNNDGGITGAKPVITFLHGVYDLPGFITVQVIDSATFREKLALSNSLYSKNITAGNNDVKFYETATSNLMKSLSINFANNKNYTVCICNKKATPDVFTLENPTSFVDTNKTAFRFINLIPSSNLEISINGSAYTTLAFKAYSNSAEYSTGSTSILVKDLSSGKATASVNFKGTAKKVYNIFVTGAPGSIPTLNFTAVN